MCVEWRLLSESRRIELDGRRVVPPFIVRHLECLVRRGPFIVARPLLVPGDGRRAFACRSLSLDLPPTEEEEAGNHDQDEDARADKDADEAPV